MRKNYGVLTLAAWLAAGAFSVASAQTVSLSIKDGRVTLKSENATVRQILDEWARVGQAKVVNAEKVTGPPMSLTLVDVPEREALDTVLRQAAGYAVVERQAAAATNVSVFDKILVMGRTTPVQQNTSASASPGPQTYTPDAGDEPIVADNEPPQPQAPVVNPYNTGGTPGAAGANGTNANNAYPGMNSGGGAGSTVNVRPPETRFDYTNPQAYFDQQRRNQQAAQQQSTTTSQPGIAPAPQPQLFNPYPGSNASPIAVQPPQSSQPTVPTATPTAGNTSSQPGIAPQPTTPPAGTGGNFNPYNMNPYQMPPNAGSAPPTTPVEPDRAKYANPYVPTKPPDQN